MRLDEQLPILLQRLPPKMYTIYLHPRPLTLLHHPLQLSTYTRSLPGGGVGVEAFSRAGDSPVWEGGDVEGVQDLLLD